MFQDTKACIIASSHNIWWMDIKILLILKAIIKNVYISDFNVYDSSGAQLSDERYLSPPPNSAGRGNPEAPVLQV